jgi:hypothetical protein
MKTSGGLIPASEWGNQSRIAGQQMQNALYLRVEQTTVRKGGAANGIWGLISR